jgi:hypothetical protein
MLAPQAHTVLYVLFYSLLATVDACHCFASLTRDARRHIYMHN